MSCSVHNLQVGVVGVMQKTLDFKEGVVDRHWSTKHTFSVLAQ